MTKIKDIHGLEWSIKFDFARAAQIKLANGFDFFDKKSIQRIVSGEIDAGALTFLICSPQAKRRAINEDDFHDRFDTSDIYAAASEAYLAFSQSLVKKVETAREAAQATTAGTGSESTEPQPSPVSKTFADEHCENLSQGPKPANAANGSAQPG